MSRDDIEARLDAVERAVTDGEIDGVADAASAAARLDELETTVEEIDDRLAEIETAVEALRGYLGGVRAVNEDVERRADAALAKVEALEAELVDEPHLRRERIDVGREGDGAGHAVDGGPEPRGGGEHGDGDRIAGRGDSEEGDGLAARIRDAL